MHERSKNRVLEGVVSVDAVQADLARIPKRGRVFADAHALGLGEQPQWLYCVVLDTACEGVGVHVSFDAWEPYLEPA